MLCFTCGEKKIGLTFKRSKYIMNMFAEYTIHWDEKQMSKKFHLVKINVTKNAIFFLSRAAIHRSFTFRWQVLCKLKNLVNFFKCAFTCSRVEILLWDEI